MGEYPSLLQTLVATVQLFLAETVFFTTSPVSTGIVVARQMISSFGRPLWGCQGQCSGYIFQSEYHRDHLKTFTINKLDAVWLSLLFLWIFYTLLWRSLAFGVFLIFFWKGQLRGLLVCIWGKVLMSCFISFFFVGRNNASRYQWQPSSVSNRHSGSHRGGEHRRWLEDYAADCLGCWWGSSCL